MFKKIDFDYNGERYGWPRNVEETITVEDLKEFKSRFRGIKDSLVLKADNDLETLMVAYELNRNSKSSRKAIINCLKKMAVVQA